MSDEPDEREIIALLLLVQRLENERSYASRERVTEAAVESLAQINPQRVVAMLERAVREGRLFADTRNRFDSASGSIVETRLYRINHRHPRAAALDERGA